jgi:hypothetical protein
MSGARERRPANDALQSSGPTGRTRDTVAAPGLAR